MRDVAAETRSRSLQYPTLRVPLQPITSTQPEIWEQPPVSFVPASHPSGPRYLPPGRYGCPVAHCLHPFGHVGNEKGYWWLGLALHIYFQHGFGRGLDNVLQQVRERVWYLRASLGKDPEIDTFRRVHAWKFNPEQDLEDGAAELEMDMEEIREWEREVVVLPGLDDSPLCPLENILDVDKSEMESTSWNRIGLMANHCREPATTHTESPRKDATGKGKAPMCNNRCVMSVSPPVAGNGEWGAPTASPGRRSLGECSLNTVPVRNNRFQRPQSKVVLHTREGLLTPRRMKRAQMPTWSEDGYASLAKARPNPFRDQGIMLEDLDDEAGKENRYLGEEDGFNLELDYGQ